MLYNFICFWCNIDWCKLCQIMVGCVLVGGDVLISVQIMMNIDSSDVCVMLDQIICVVDVGVDIVCVFIFDVVVMQVLCEICCESLVLIVVDIYFYYKCVIEVVEVGVVCLCINFGNIGDVICVCEVIKVVCDYGCLICIGVNVGSLEKYLLEKYGEFCLDVMVEFGLDYIKILQDNDFYEFKISVKVLDVFFVVVVYQQLVDVIDVLIYLGIIEVGGFVGGMVKLVIGFGNFLWMGIGDMICVSLFVDLVEEVKVGFEILKLLGLCMCGVQIIFCFSCVCQGFDVIKIVEMLEKWLEYIK